MSTRRVPVIVWLVTTGLMAGAGWFAYRSLTEVGDLAGRTEPAALYDDPTLLFEDPGILGSAIELRVTEAVRACMEARGLPYRGPAVVSSIDPAGDGYGIATGAPVPDLRLGDDGPSRSERADYEQALYGASDELLPGSCAEVGVRELNAALGAIDSFEYSIEQLEADALAHPTYREAEAAWSDCMAEKGYVAASPLDLIRDQQARLATASPDEARALADRERDLAEADFACRERTIDPAGEAVAAELAPLFVQRNRPQLEALVPPPADQPIDLPSDLGSGDVQVTLRWSSSVDLDLEVTDPTGAVTNFITRESSSGGQLDRDANYPCNEADRSPIENIFWPEGAAPAGPYTVRVIYQSGCADSGPQPFELIVQVGGSVVIREQRTLESGGSHQVEFDR
jgi:hypothetical protein